MRYRESGASDSTCGTTANKGSRCGTGIARIAGDCIVFDGSQLLLKRALLDGTKLTSITLNPSAYRRIAIESFEQLGGTSGYEVGKISISPYFPFNPAAVGVGRKPGDALPTWANSIPATTRHLIAIAVDSNTSNGEQE
jgi:hypothetical protein